MATLDVVINTLVTNLTAALAGLTVDGNALTIVIGEGWAGDDLLEDVARGNALISVIHKMTTNQQKYIPYRRAVTNFTTGITTTLSAKVLNPGQYATLTIGLVSGNSEPNLNDSISLNAQVGVAPADAATTQAAAGATLATMATALAAAINGKTTLGSWITATSSGAVVTLYNKTSATPIQLQSFVGNLSTYTNSVGCATRDVQLNVYTNTIDARYAIVNVVESLLAGYDADYGYALPSGELVRVVLRASKENDQDRQKDIFDWIFLVDLEHSVDTQTNAYAVLAPLLDITDPDSNISVQTF